MTTTTTTTSFFNRLQITAGLIAGVSAAICGLTGDAAGFWQSAVCAVTCLGLYEFTR